MSHERTEDEETRDLEIHLDKAVDQLAMCHSLTILTPEGISRIEKIQGDLMDLAKEIVKEAESFHV